jgi:hypothetical protein
MITAFVLDLSALYLGAGFIFAIIFILKGIQKMDPAAHGSSWGFRILIIPGMMLMWPVLLRKWLTLK